MQIRTASYVAASLLLDQEPGQWHTLIILDSGKRATDFVQSRARSYCILRFDDVEGPRPKKATPTTALIEQGLDFASGKDKLLVCCRAGQSRSVGLAYVICCREKGVEEALKLLNPTRHCPNRLVISLGEGLLETVALLAPFDEWRHRHAHIRLSDYYDDMEKEFEALEAQGASNKICEP